MVCPYADEDNERCRKHLSLDNLEFALSVCGEAFTSCEIYKEYVLARQLELQRC